MAVRTLLQGWAVPNGQGWAGVHLEGGRAGPSLNMGVTSGTSPQPASPLLQPGWAPDMLGRVLGKSSGCGFQPLICLLKAGGSSQAASPF